MKKIVVFSATLAILLSSCVSQKKYAALEAKQQETQSLLDDCTTKLRICEQEKESMATQIRTLENTNSALLMTQGNLATLSQKAAENLNQSLKRIQEKDLKIQALHEALNKKDSVTLALVTSLKGALGTLSGDDIQISVEKGVVFVSISDKLLFKSGSYKVTDRAREVLAKVAKVVKAKPDFEFMVEGHTDNVPIHNSCLEDNWDLSVHRATSIVRILQEDFGVPPSRMTAAGRGEYIPIASNSTSEGRARNRRTRIVILPELGQFYGMIEEGMKKAAAASEKMLNEDIKTDISKPADTGEEPEGRN
ncbi:MAG TPA: OmpA family protein [Flavobacteriaceae bacterium]|nr:OmpA family protein [Flavobacteriaceae bacterium]